MMKEKRIGCKSCGSYSYRLARCIKGMINPRTIKAAKSAAVMMGSEYICNINGMRDKLNQA